jgi:hypothetical protein
MLLDLIKKAQEVSTVEPDKQEGKPPAAEQEGLAAIAREMGLEVESTKESDGLVSVAAKLAGYDCDITLTTSIGGSGAVVPRVHTHTLPGIAYAGEKVAERIAKALVPYVMQYPHIERQLTDPVPQVASAEATKDSAEVKAEEDGAKPEEQKATAEDAMPTTKAQGFGRRQPSQPEAEGKV